MFTRFFPYSLVLTSILTLTACSSMSPADSSTSKAEQRDALRGATRDVLAELYKVQPGARRVLEGATGHAVFTNFGMKLFVAGAGRGWGMAINKQNGAETFMQMVELQAGLGFGVKKFQLVWVFETPEALAQFVNAGWELSAQTTAAAQVQDQGIAFAGAIAIAPGIWLYQLIDQGLALELTIKGSKYFKDNNLN